MHEQALPVDDEVFARVLQLQVDKYAHAPEPGVLDERFAALKQYVQDLEKHGVHVIFYEMPLHPILCSSPLADALRSHFHQFFPPSKYRYIPAPDCSRYHTTDGIHLSRAEGALYSEYLSGQAEKATTLLRPALD